MSESVKNKSEGKVSTAELAPSVNKKRPPQAVIDKMNRAIGAAAETGMTPGQLEDAIYREMFGDDD